MRTDLLNILLIILLILLIILLLITLLITLIILLLTILIITLLLPLTLLTLIPGAVRHPIRVGWASLRSQTTTSVLMLAIHPVSITRFPLTRFSPGAGLLRNPFCHR